MFKLILVSLIFISTLFSSIIQEEEWQNGETLLTFFEKNNISLQVYYNLAREDKELVTEIIAGVKFYKLKDEKTGVIKQLLIPISDEMQIHISQNNNLDYNLNIIPIIYNQKDESLALSIKSSPYQDIINQTNNKVLANEFISVYKRSIDFRRDLRKDDELVILYKQKYRLGKPFSLPLITATMIETRKKPNFLFLYSDGRYYNKDGKAIEGFLMNRPVVFTRISSSFTLKRWHPILKRYRAHLGVDYAARKGTPVKAAANGKIVYRSRKGGYGKTVQIQHNGGYKTLYAHLNNYNKFARLGKRVRKGQVIGYVGNTGMSTGPHLHFGVYKNNRAINPSKVIKVTKTQLYGVKKRNFLKAIKKSKDLIHTAIVDRKEPHRIEAFASLIDLQNIKYL